MKLQAQGDWLTPKTPEFDNLARWFDAFLLDRRAQGLATGTLEFYVWKLRLVDRFFYARSVTAVTAITADLIRALLIELELSHNPGGVHQVYRVIRTFLKWYELEAEPDNWRNPIQNVKPPKLSGQPLAPLDTRVLHKLIDACPVGFTGTRDKAMMLFLLDTGVRASELCALDLDDIDEVEGSVMVRNGKGGKPRIVVMGKRTRKAVRLYLRSRSDDAEALWVTDEFERISYRAVDNMLRRRAAQAGVPKPMLHDFRRAFALSCLRNGMDVYSLQRLMGHADLSVLRRYLAQTDDDMRLAHAKASPVDNW